MEEYFAMKEWINRHDQRNSETESLEEGNSWVAGAVRQVGWHEQRTENAERKEGEQKLVSGSTMK